MRARRPWHLHEQNCSYLPAGKHRRADRRQPTPGLGAGGRGDRSRDRGDLRGARERREASSVVRPHDDRCETRAFDVLLVWSLDRFGRSMAGNVNDALALDAVGVKIVSVREPWLDTGGPVRYLLLAIFSWVAEQELRRLVERMRAGIERARALGTRSGKPIGRPRHLPWSSPMRATCGVSTTLLWVHNEWMSHQTRRLSTFVRATGLVVAVALLGSACGASTHAPIGRSYACLGDVGDAATGGGGFDGGGESGDASAESVMCVVGDAYCHLFYPNSGGRPPPFPPPIPTCVKLPACTDNPTCACLCASGVWCHTECSCIDTGGFVTVSCQQI